MKAVGFLQNPWSPFYAGTTDWPRENWLVALAKSRSGQRLKLLEHPDLQIWYDNACPIACANPRDILPADLFHMRDVLKKQNPDFIITFGVPAAIAMGKLRVEFKQPVMCLPHPAYRLVPNKLFEAALKNMIAGFEGWIKYMPKRGGTVEISINQ